MTEPAIAEAPPADPKTAPAPPKAPEKPVEEKKTEKKAVPEEKPEPVAAEEAPETGEGEPEEEGEEGDEEEISIEATINGEKKTLSGSDAIDYMNQTIERAIEIHEATRKANIRRLENPLATMVDELAAGKFGGDRNKAGDHLLQLMEKALLEHLEDMDKPEAERKARDLEAQLAAEREKLARIEKAREEEEWNEQVAEAGEKIAAEFHSAFKELELDPADDDLKGIIIERMLAQRRRGLTPSVRGVAEKLKKEMAATFEAAGKRHLAAKEEAKKKTDFEAIRKSREEEGAAGSQKTPSKDGPERGYVLRDRDFLKD